MRKKGFMLLSAVALFSLAMTSCQGKYKLSKVEVHREVIDSRYDNHKDAEAASFLAPYKVKVDSMMNHAICVSSMELEHHRPESTLSNLLSDLLRDNAKVVLGHPADVALMNMGGIRGNFSKGTITQGDIFEVLPFQNALCVLTLKGNVLRELFENIAARGGEGISGAKMVISPKGKLLSCSVNGKQIDDNKEYTVATLDYLADGNDGMTAFFKATKRECPENAAVRDLFMRYAKECNAAGKTLEAKIEGRLIVKE